LDKRKTCVSDLKELVIRHCTSEPGSNETNDVAALDVQKRKETCLNILFDEEKPVYWLLVNRVDTSSNGGGRFSYYVKSILNHAPADENVHKMFSAVAAAQKNTSTSSVLVLSRHCDQWPVGDEFEPVRVVFKYFDRKFEIKESSYTFTKSTQIKHVKEELAAFMAGDEQMISADGDLQLSSDEMKLILGDTFSYSLIRMSKKSNGGEKLDAASEHKSLGELEVKNGDVITAESSASVDRLFESKLSLSNAAPLATTSTTTTHSLAAGRSHEINLVNLLYDPSELLAADLKIDKLTVDECETIKNIRIMALSFFNLEPSKVIFNQVNAKLKRPNH
jgi:hypothetical protein